MTTGDSSRFSGPLFFISVAGSVALVFALLRDRRAAGLGVLLGALIPLGDALIVWTKSPTPLQFLPFHGGGVLGCLVFAFLLLRRCGES